ncbi:glycosyltransferase family 2 protein [Uliginosibacterium sp. H1]|uniref:glycosyltransferase family 2 protein n=1 Tax=Uliginosibacterium sp. H1 TaxID=3114757 RepID=UPI002E16C115|nr:glycosyltransferase family 2 protein [Uliginosibacterium sp. H1]
MPSVSVVIPSYNRGHCVRESIDSVLQQSFQDFEIIVVDDASKDDTAQQVAAITDPRVRYIRHETNKGGAAARNTGIQASTAEYIAFLDSDDNWTPDKLAKQVAMLDAKGPAYGFNYTWFIGRNPEGREVWRRNDTVDGLAVPELLRHNCVGTFSSVLARRSALLQVGGLDDKMRSCQDWDLFVRLNAATAVCCVPEYLVYYLQDGGDKHRISANPTSIILGHRRMLGKLRERLPGMPAEQQALTLKQFTGIFVIAGSGSDVIKSGLEVLGKQFSARNFLWFTASLLRVTKRKLSGNLGY